MKRLILAILLVTAVLFSVNSWAFPPVMMGGGGGGGGVELAADCNSAAYFSIGTLCQQTGDGKLFKGTGAAVVEITAGTGIAADGSVAWTGAPIPNAANTIALGSNAAEWADIFLGDGAIIYGQNDSSNTITSSAAGWVFALPVNLVSTGVKLTGANGVLTILGQGDGQDENMTLDFNTTANVVTIASGTSATFAFTPNVAFTGDITVVGADITLISATAGAGITGGDGTISLKGLGSGTDEIMTIDLNTNNLITFDSTTSATFAFTPAVTFTSSISVGTTANPDTDGGASLGTKNTLEWQNLYLNTGGVIGWENDDVTLTHSANTLTLAGGDLALGANNLTLTGSVGATGAGKATKLWAVDAELTNLPTINGGTLVAALAVDDLITLSGVASGAANLGTFTGTTITDNQTIKAAFQLLETAFEALPGGHTQNTDTGTDSTSFTFGSGGIKLKTNSGVLEVRNNADSAYDDFKALTINGTTITATVGFSGALTGDVTGNVSGTAATVTGAAQTAITSLGTLTGLTVSGAIVPNAVGTIDLGSTSAELRNIFLGNGGILYGQIDQSATLTSSLNTWTASNFATTGIMTIGTQLLPDANDGATIGISGTAWSDLFLASGAVINFNADDVTLTHSANTLTLGGGDLALGTNNITGVGYISFGADPADAGAIRLSNNTFVFSEKASTGTDISVIGVDASDVVQIAASGSSGVTITPAATFTGAATFNGNITAGNADTDTVTVQSMIIGGNSREVQINASTRTAPTYPSAAPTQDLYVKGNIETPGVVYASSFNTGPGTDTQRGITLTSNTALTPTADQIYFINDVLYFSQAGAQKTPMRLEDAQTATGIKTFQAGAYFGDATTTTVLRLYDGSSNYWSIAVPAMAANYTLTLPADDGTANQALITDGSGTLSWGTASATAAGASAGMVQYNATGTGGALAASAHFIYTEPSAALLTIGSKGTGKTGNLALVYEGGASDYTATIAPNASMAGDITITLPAGTSTLIGSGANTFTGAQILAGVNPADGSLDSLTLSGTLGAFNGSDTFRGLYLNYTNANHAGTGNTVALIDIPAITGDANSNLYGLRIGNLTGTTGAAGEVEYGISIGTGWDYGLYSGSSIYVAGAVLAGGTNTFNLTNGTASLDVAAGAALNIDTSLQTTTGAIILAGQAGGSSVTIPSSGTLATTAGTLPIGGGTLTGNLLFTDNTLDIGATGATRPRTGYFGTSLAVQATTNQLVMGASTNLTTVNFPASSGAVTLTMPNTTSTVAILGANAFTGAQTFTGSGGLTSPPITTDLRAVTAGGATVGTAALPFSSVYIGNAATNNIQLTGTSAAARSATIPDIAANSTFLVTNTTSTTAGQIPASTTTAGKHTYSTSTYADTYAAGTVLSASTANTVTGVTSLNLTGTIQGLIKVTIQTADANIANSALRGDFHSIDGAHTMTFTEEAVAGQSACFYSSTAASIVLHPYTTDHFVLAGAAKADHATITSPATAGSFVCIIATATGIWETVGMSGTWTSP